MINDRTRLQWRKIHSQFNCTRRLGIIARQESIFSSVRNVNPMKLLWCVVFDRTLSWRIISIFNILYFFPWQTTYRKKKLRQRTIFLWFTGWTSGWQLKWFISCISMVVWLYIRMNIWRIAACATGRRGSSPKYLRAPFTYTPEYPSAVQCIHLTINMLPSEKWNYASRGSE